MPTFREINFSPYATNVLDVVGDESLLTPDGRGVRVYRSGMAFEVFIGGTLQIKDGDNLSVSFYLNRRQVGRMS